MLSSMLFITASFFADQPAWPGFLGAGATEIDPATIPLKWSPTENVAWDAFRVVIAANTQLQNASARDLQRPS